MQVEHLPHTFRTLQNAPLHEHCGYTCARQRTKKSQQCRMFLFSTAEHPRFISGVRPGPSRLSPTPSTTSLSYTRSEEKKKRPRSSTSSAKQSTPRCMGPTTARRPTLRKKLATAPSSWPLSILVVLNGRIVICSLCLTVAARDAAREHLQASATFADGGVSTYDQRFSTVVRPGR
jgi:hypothetical protein